MVLGNVGTLLKEYKVYVKYFILFSAAYLVKYVFEYLYNRSTKKSESNTSTVDVSKLCMNFHGIYFMCLFFIFIAGRTVVEKF